MRELEIEVERTLFGKIVGAKIRGVVQRIASDDLSSQLEAFLRIVSVDPSHPLSPALSSAAKLSEEILVNFRGRPTADGKSEVLFQALGTDLNDPSGEHTLYEVSSRFVDIQKGCIRSEFSIRTAPALRPLTAELGPLYLGRIAPFAITRLALGWQYFKRRGLGAHFGFAPFPDHSGGAKVGEELIYELSAPVTSIEEIGNGAIARTLASLDSFCSGAPLRNALRRWVQER